MKSLRSGWHLAFMAMIAAVAGLSNPVQAALFGGDDEARRAILELRQRLEQSQNATRLLIEQSVQSQNQTQNQAIAQLRSQGETVVCVLPGHESEVDEFDCDRALVPSAGQWVVQAI